MSLEKIGVTGHTSFLGRQLVNAFGRSGKEVILFNGDIRNSAEVSDFVKACNIIYHLAGCNRGTDEDVYEINMIGGSNIIATAVTLGKRHIVFPSSNYYLKDPTNPYSISKSAVEGMLRQFANFNNCKASVFRLSNIYGPQALPFYVSVVATFCWYEANNLGDRMPIIGDGSQIVELVPIDVVIDSFLNALHDDGPFKLTEIRGQKFSVSNLANTIREPELIKAYPTLVETLDFFRKPLDIQISSLAAIVSEGHNTLTLKLNCNTMIVLYQLEVFPIPPGYHRLFYQSFFEKSWICSDGGNVALDIFLQNEEYVNTILIDGTAVKCLAITPIYKFRIRNLSKNSITIKIFREKDSD